MQWQSTPYEVPLLIAASASAGIAAYLWRHRRAPGALALALLLMGTAWWSFFYAVQLASAGLGAQRFWDNLAYIGVLISPLAWLAFALEYSGRGHWLNRQTLPILAAIPAFFLVVVWTSGPGGSFITHLRLREYGGFKVMTGDVGPLFWVTVGYGYTFIAAGTLLLSPFFAGIVHPNPFYRGQAFFLLLSVAMPWAANVLYLNGHSPFGPVDITPLAFAVSGAALAWSLLRYKLLDIVPVARAAVVDSMSEVVLVLDEQGRLLDLNAAARETLGAGKWVVGRSLGEVFALGAELLAHCRGDLTGHAAVTLRDGASRRTFEARISPLRHASGHLSGHLVVMDDVTARVQAEEALRANDERLIHIFEAAPIGAALLDGDDCIVQVNRAFREMLGHPRRELLGRRLSDFTHTEDVGKDAALAARTQAGDIAGYKLEQRFVKRDRDILWAEVTVTAMREGNAIYRLVMVENVFERKRAELLEDEQRHVAYELHDGLAQVAAGAHLHLQAFAGHYRPQSPQARAELDRALDLVQRAAREARHVIAGLRPTVVEELGLASALGIQAESLRAEGWTVTYDESLGEERLSAATETALFRIALEALTNIRKHAGMKRVQVRLGQRDHAVWLEIRDFGRGFDPAAPRDPADGVGHIGLREMEDRVALLGGTFTLESRPGGGTCITVEAPLTGGGSHMVSWPRLGKILEIVPARAQAQDGEYPELAAERDGQND